MLHLYYANIGQISLQFIDFFKTKEKNDIMNLLLLIQSYGGFQFPSFTYLPLSWNVQVTHTHTRRIECRPAACILQNHALIFFPIEVFVRLRFPLIMTFDFGNLHILIFCWLTS